MVHALERLQNQGDDKAWQFLASIMRFQFIIALVIAEHILHSTVYLSTVLQDTDYDILEAIKESKTVIEMLKAERQDESAYLPSNPFSSGPDIRNIYLFGKYQNFTYRKDNNPNGQLQSTTIYLRGK